jgi:4-hydroxybenzoate polyprenyltransferase
MIAGFLWSYAMHVYSAVPDITADTDAGLKTGATILGKNTTLALCGILYAASGILTLPYIGVFSYIAIAVYLVMIAISIKKKGPIEVLPIYKYFPLINTIIGGIIFFILLYKNIF